MRDVGNHRSARSIGLALVAGLILFEAVLALGAGAIGIPGVLMLSLTGEHGGAQIARESASEGGESVMAKLATPPASPPAAPPPAADTTAATAPKGEPRLDGLADIPLQEWIAPKSEPKAENPDAPPRAREELPWDAVEPVPFDAGERSAVAHADATAMLPAASTAAPQAPVQLAPHPNDAAVEGWVKAKAVEVKGPERIRPLFHFEFWLEPPEDVKRRLLAVAYEFNTPAVMPQAQMSREKATGFRVSAGGLTCADKVKVTLKFNDGSSQQVTVDGCRLLG